jgi:hypothetical protein
LPSVFGKYRIMRRNCGTIIDAKNTIEMALEWAARIEKSATMIAS